MRQSIEQHEGKKYLKTIQPAGNISQSPILIDVYCVLDAFGITCPATAHAIKKLLCAGERDKGSRKDDLIGALAAINRAIDMEERRMPKMNIRDLPGASEDTDEETEYIKPGRTDRT